MSRDAQKTLPARIHLSPSLLFRRPADYWIHDMTAPLSSAGFSWEPINTAPIDEDVTVLVTDGASEYRIPLPCRLTAASGWVNLRKGTALSVTPTKWRRC
jgi:hypothetical protein